VNAVPFRASRVGRAIEHADATCDLDHLRRRPRPIAARAVFGQLRFGVLDGCHHFRLVRRRMVTTDSVAIEADLHERSGGLAPQIGMTGTLHDAEFQAGRPDLLALRRQRSVWSRLAAASS
jgi:hypothetical protein